MFYTRRVRRNSVLQLIRRTGRRTMRNSNGKNSLGSDEEVNKDAPLVLIRCSALITIIFANKAPVMIHFGDCFEHPDFKCRCGFESTRKSSQHLTLFEWHDGGEGRKEDVLTSCNSKQEKSVKAAIADERGMRATWHLFPSSILEKSMFDSFCLKNGSLIVLFTPAKHDFKRLNFLSSCEAVNSGGP